MAPTPEKDAITAALATVEDPEIRRPITELDMVKDIVIGPDGAVTVGVFLTVAGCPMRTEITDRVTRAVSEVAGVTEVAVELDVMSDQQRETLRPHPELRRRADVPERANVDETRAPGFRESLNR